jgi:hypothetical protein
VDILNMTPEKFVKLVGYKPKFITKTLKGDPNPVRLICFRDFNKHSATVEFGCELNEKMKGFYFYFEVLNLTAYKEMDFIPLDSAMRHDVILSWPKCDEDYKKLASKVKEALKHMYKRS